MLTLGIIYLILVNKLNITPSYECANNLLPLHFRPILLYFLRMLGLELHKPSFLFHVRPHLFP